MTNELESELLPTRKSLLVRLKDLDNQESWQEFFDLYWRLIYSTAIRSGLVDSEAQEVVQETIITVCRNIGRLEYDPKVGSFKTWLLNLTRWRVIDQLRKRQPGLAQDWAVDGDSKGTDLLHSIPDPLGVPIDRYWDEEWEKNVMDAAITRAKAQVDPKHYQVFDLYVLQELPPAEVAQLMGLTVARVYLIKHRVSRIIEKAAKKLRAGKTPNLS